MDSEPARTSGAIAQAVGGRLWGSETVPISGVTRSTDQVQPGALFCCVQGEHVDGHELAPAAVEAGASCLLVDHRLEDLAVAQIEVPDTRAAMGPAASAFFGSPSSSVSVIGVTGTSGKTSTVTFIGQLLSALDRPSRVIGTLTGSLTTPDAPDLQRLLAEARDDGVDVVAMEVSSHALELHRVGGVSFAVAAFTNLGRDHLDFHRTPERYFAAKAKLFEPTRSERAVVCVDDVHGRLLASTLTQPLVRVAVGELSDLRRTPTGSTFTWRDRVVELSLIGRHNVANALVAAECVVAVGAEPAAVAAAMSDLHAPAGRFEPVRVGQPFDVVVDFAHKPEALEGVLEAAREWGSGRVLVVFGCGGDRDPGKRPIMGAIADRCADRVFVTSDNPRSEDPSTIIAAVCSGLKRQEPVVEPDRRRAIERAIGEALPGDVVVIAGKGHETVQRFADHDVPFDDRIVAADVLRAVGYGVSA